jgi:hypothetical protein
LTRFDRARERRVGGYEDVLLSIIRRKAEAQAGEDCFEVCFFGLRQCLRPNHIDQPRAGAWHCEGPLNSQLRFRQQLFITTNNTGTGTYTVATDGTLTLTDPTGDVENGAISADGNALVLASVASEQNPAIFVGVRQ